MFLVEGDFLVSYKRVALLSSASQADVLSVELIAHNVVDHTGIQPVTGRSKRPVIFSSLMIHVL